MRSTTSSTTARSILRARSTRRNGLSILCARQSTTRRRYGEARRHRVEQEPVQLAQRWRIMGGAAQRLDLHQARQAIGADGDDAARPGDAGRCRAIEGATGRRLQADQRALRRGWNRSGETSVMTYTDEQRAIIERMGVISRRLRALVESNRSTNADASRDIANLMGHLIDSNERLAEIVTLGTEHGDAFR